MATHRSQPYIWITWLTGLLAGDRSCEWAAWFKAHYRDYDRVPDSFDQARWLMEHTDLLNQAHARLEADGYTVFREAQNAFKLKGSSGIVLHVRPDLVAFRDDSALIVDTKSGKQRPSDTIQVMIYMWALPLALKQFRRAISAAEASDIVQGTDVCRALRLYQGTFDGQVVYKDAAIPIPANAVDKDFQDRLVALIKRVGGTEPLRSVPSPTECGFCPIARTECEWRIEGLAADIDLEELEDF